MLSFFPMNSFCAIEDHLFPVPIRVRFPVTKSSTVVLLNIFLCHWGPYNPVSTQQVQIFWFWSNYGKYIVPMLILSSCWICNEAVAQVNQIFFRFYLCMRLPQEKCPTRPPWHRTISSSRTTFNGPYAWEDSSTQGGTNNNTKILYSPGKKDAHGWEYYF
jgi:hypothetical protein